MPDSKKETTTNVIITLDEKGNENVDGVIQELTKSGFTHSRTLDFGEVNIVFGTKSGNLAELEKVEGVKAVEVEGTKVTSTFKSPDTSLD